MCWEEGLGRHSIFRTIAVISNAEPLLICMSSCNIFLQLLYIFLSQIFPRCCKSELSRKELKCTCKRKRGTFRSSPRRWTERQLTPEIRFSVNQIIWHEIIHKTLIGRYINKLTFSVHLTRSWLIVTNLVLLL